MGYASHLAVKALDTAVVPLTRYLQSRFYSVPILMRHCCSSNLDLGLKLYYVQLGLNCLWTPLFFGARQVRPFLSALLILAELLTQTGAALIDSALLAGTSMYMTVRL